LHLFFTSNSAVFVAENAKIFFALGAEHPDYAARLYRVYENIK